MASEDNPANSGLSRSNPLYEAATGNEGIGDQVGDDKYVDDNDNSTTEAGGDSGGSDDGGGNSGSNGGGSQDQDATGSTTSTDSGQNTDSSSEDGIGSAGTTPVKPSNPLYDSVKEGGGYVVDEETGEVTGGPDGDGTARTDEERTRDTSESDNSGSGNDDGNNSTPSPSERIGGSSAGATASPGATSTQSDSDGTTDPQAATDPTTSTDSGLNTDSDGDDGDTYSEDDPRDEMTGEEILYGEGQKVTNQNYDELDTVDGTVVREETVQDVQTQALSSLRDQTGGDGQFSTDDIEVTTAQRDGQQVVTAQLTDQGRIDAAAAQSDQYTSDDLQLTEDGVEATDQALRERVASQSDRYDAQDLRVTDEGQVRVDLAENNDQITEREAELIRQIGVENVNRQDASAQAELQGQPADLSELPDVATAETPTKSTQLNTGTESIVNSDSQQGNPETQLDQSVAQFESVTGTDVPGEGDVIPNVDVGEEVESSTGVPVPESAGAAVTETLGVDAPTESDVAQAAVNAPVQLYNAAKDVNEATKIDSVDNRSRAEEVQQSLDSGATGVLREAQLQTEVELAQLTSSDTDAAVANRVRRQSRQQEIKGIQEGPKASPAPAIGRNPASGINAARAITGIAGITGGAFAVNEISVPEEQSNEELQTPENTDVGNRQEIEVPEEEVAVNPEELGVPREALQDERAEINGPDGTRLNDDGEIIIPAGTTAVSAGTRQESEEREDVVEEEAEEDAENAGETAEEEEKVQVNVPEELLPDEEQTIGEEGTEAEEDDLTAEPEETVEEEAEQEEPEEVEVPFEIPRQRQVENDAEPEDTQSDEDFGQQRQRDGQASGGEATDPSVSVGDSVFPTLGGTGQQPQLPGLAGRQDQTQQPGQTQQPRPDQRQPVDVGLGQDTGQAQGQPVADIVGDILGVGPAQAQKPQQSNAPGFEFPDVFQQSPQNVDVTENTPETQNPNPNQNVQERRPSRSRRGARPRFPDIDGDSDSDEFGIFGDASPILTDFQNPLTGERLETESNPADDGFPGLDF